MESKEINITYETLYEILKREKDITELQKLDLNFFNEFIDYLNEKKKLLEKDDSLFSYDEKKKVEKQIDNTKRIIKEIYERREKKIINTAMINSRTKSNVIDTSAFLEHEKNFFDEVLMVMNKFRNDVINNIIIGKNLLIENKKTEKKVDEIKQEKDTKLVRFLYSIPKFVGKELEEYGPFEEEDIANLPTEIAQLLIDKDKVEEITNS